jgi:hypothetical protein
MTTLDPRRGVPSCSSLARLDACPASWHLSKGLPDVVGEAAESGTRIHLALEQLGRFSEYTVELTEDEKNTVEMCWSQARKIMREYDSGVEHYELRLGMTPPPSCSVVRVTDTCKLPVEITGQADVIAIQGDRAIVLDYKTGRGDVDHAADNAQLRGLSVLVAKHFRVSHVRVAIVQPWSGPPTIADYEKQALQHASHWLNIVLQQVEHATLDTLRPGDHCQYCKAKAVCPALRKQALEPVVELAAPLPSGEAKATLFQRALELTPDKLAELYRGLKLVSWYKDAVETAMRQRVEAREVDGYTLKPGSVRERIVDVGKVWERCESRGVNALEFTRACTVTKKELKPLLAKATGAKGKALDAELDAVVEGAVEAKQAADTIAETK